MKNAPQVDPITVVISEIVDPDQIEKYEIWARGINQASRQFDGYLGTDVIRPRDHEHPEYVIIVKFDNYTHLKNWLTSSIYKEWMAKSHNLIAARSHQHLPDGLELWFTLPKSTPQKPPQPAYYKKVILGVLSVYPVILLVNAVLNPLLSGLPSLLSLLISVIFVSALLTYPVMPWLTRLLNFWLYPSSKQHRRSKGVHNPG